MRPVNAWFTPTTAIVLAAAMQGLGIGARSERVVAPERSVVLRRSGYDVVLQPDRPDYHFGNCLVLPGPPQADELALWRDVWRRELGSIPGVERIVIVAESEETDPPDRLAEAAAAQGLELEIEQVHTLGELLEAPVPSGTSVRPVEDEEWPALVALDLEHAAELGASPDFRRWRMAEYRRLVERGAGSWWAAWRERALAGSAGIFRGDGLARYQHVVVSVEHRRQSVAAALVSAMAADHLEWYPGVPAVIVADRGSSAARVYGRLGFQPVSVLLSLVGDLPA